MGYIEGTYGTAKGYGLTAAARGTVNPNTGKPFYPQWMNGGQLIQLDLVIANSMTTALQIELFNYFRSQFRQYSASNQCNDYYPVGIDGLAGQPGATNGTYSNPSFSVPQSNVTNGYAYGVFAGAYTAYTDAAAPIVPAGTTRNTCFFDIYGNAVYQPGYASGTLPSGNVIISCNQMPYQQLFLFTSANKIIIDCIKFQYNTQAQTSQMQQVVYHKYFSSTGVASNTENYTPSTFFSSSDYQANIVTVPVDKKITAQWGIWTNILGQQQSTTTQCTMTLFLWVDADALRTDSNPAV